MYYLEIYIAPNTLHLSISQSCIDSCSILIYNPELKKLASMVGNVYLAPVFWKCIVTAITTRRRDHNAESDRQIGRQWLLSANLSYYYALMDHYIGSHNRVLRTRAHCP